MPAWRWLRFRERPSTEGFQEGLFLPFPSVSFFPCLHQPSFFFSARNSTAGLPHARAAPHAFFLLLLLLLRSPPPSLPPFHPPSPNDPPGAGAGAGGLLHWRTPGAPAMADHRLPTARPWS
jgi:hypothetical protein